MLTVSLPLSIGSSEFELPPGQYEIEAQGTAGAETAQIQIQVTDASGKLAGESTVRLPTVAAGAQAGDVGRGRASATAVPNVVTEVKLPFVWRGAPPSSGFDVELDFRRAPDIRYFIVTPAPNVPSDYPLEIDVGVPPAKRLQCEATLTDTAGDPFGPPASLPYDPAAGTCRGIVRSPFLPGVFRLSVAVLDLDTNAANHVAKEITVSPSPIDFDSPSLCGGGGGAPPNGMPGLPPKEVKCGEKSVLRFEDQNADGKYETIFVDDDDDGHWNLGHVDRDGDGTSDEMWRDNDDDGDWDTRLDDRGADGEWHSGRQDNDGDGKFDREWKDANGDGKASQDEVRPLDPPVLIEGPKPNGKR